MTDPVKLVPHSDIQGLFVIKQDDEDHVKKYFLGDSKGPSIIYTNGICCDAEDPVCKPNFELHVQTLRERYGNCSVTIFNIPTTLLQYKNRDSDQDKRDLDMSKELVHLIREKLASDHGNVHLIGFSYGTLITKLALEALKPDERARLSYDGYGGIEMLPKNLASRVHNFVNTKDALSINGNKYWDSKHTVDTMMKIAEVSKELGCSLNEAAIQCAKQEARIFNPSVEKKSRIFKIAHESDCSLKAAARYCAIWDAYYRHDKPNDDNARSMEFWGGDPNVAHELVEPELNEYTELVKDLKHSDENLYKIVRSDEPTMSGDDKYQRVLDQYNIEILEAKVPKGDLSALEGDELDDQMRKFIVNFGILSNSYHMVGKYCELRKLPILTSN